MILDAISNGDFRPEQMGFMDDEKYQDAMQEIRRCRAFTTSARRGMIKKPRAGPSAARARKEERDFACSSFETTTPRAPTPR